MEKKRDSFFLAKKQKAEKSTKQKAEVPSKPNKRQEQFDNNRDVKKVNTGKENPDKKPFDKKTYCLKKYSKKYKLEQWEEQRKKKLIREYQKDVKNDPIVGSYKPKSFDEDTTDSQDVGKYVRHPDIIEKENMEGQRKKDPLKKENVEVKPKKDPFKKAKDQFNKVKEDKIKKREELEKVLEERNKKLKEYKKNKQERFRKLSKKNKKGQPMMTGRLELLLEKIQKG